MGDYLGAHLGTYVGLFLFLDLLMPLNPMPVDLAKEDEKEEEVPGSLFLVLGTAGYILGSHLSQKQSG